MTETNNVTLELSTGRFVHVMATANHIEDHLDRLDHQKVDGMLALQRMDDQTVLIRASAVVGVYPLDSRSESPDFDEIRVTILRPSELAIKMGEAFRRYGFGGPR